jgi:hypothetical protein
MRYFGIGKVVLELEQESILGTEQTLQSIARVHSNPAELPRSIASLETGL